MKRHSSGKRQQNNTNAEDLKYYIVDTGANGQLSLSGLYQTTEDDLKRIVSNIISYFQTNPGTNRIAFYCHGGLVSEALAVEAIMPRYKTFLTNGVYPVFFMWESTFLDALVDHLEEKINEYFSRITAAETLIDELIEEAAKMFPEPWDEMKKRGSQVFASYGGGWRFFVMLAKALQKNNLQAEMHLVGHSAGSIVIATLLKQLLEHQLTVYPYLKLMTCNLYAPACTTDVFDNIYAPALDRLIFKRFFLYTLSDELERADPTVPLYHKSLLYLISRGLEAQTGDKPILGMQLYAERDQPLQNILQSGRGAWLLVEGPGSSTVFNSTNGPLELRSSCIQHGGFSFDRDTLNSTMRVMLNSNDLIQPFE